MCLAIPGQISKIQGHKAEVKYPHEARQVLVGDDPVKVGDWVMIQMGIVVKILSEKEALASRKAWKMN